MDNKEFEEIKKLLEGIDEEEKETEKAEVIEEETTAEPSIYDESLYKSSSEDEEADEDEDEDEDDGGYFEDEPEKKTLVKEVFEWIESVAISVVLVVLLFSFIFRIVMVDGKSMLNTLHNKDRVVITNFLYTPKAGDIIVFVPDLETYEGKPFVKRVIATEGQTITVDANLGKVFINGIAIDEPYIRETLVKQGDQKYPLTVPEGHIFAMGDNRNDSFDSRYTEVGTVDIRSVLGKVIYRVYPFNNVGKLG